VKTTRSSGQRKLGASRIEIKTGNAAVGGLKPPVQPAHLC
jgi:hypothetical protein